MDKPHHWVKSCIKKFNPAFLECNLHSWNILSDVFNFTHFEYTFYYYLICLISIILTPCSFWEWFQSSIF